MTIADAVHTETLEMTLQHIGEACANTPDKAVIDIDSDLLKQIARGLLALKGMAIGVSEVKVPMAAHFRLLMDGEELDEGDPDGSDGSFRMSSAWLLIEADGIALEVWEEYSDDELFGRTLFAHVPGLSTLIANATASEASAFAKRVAGT